MGAALAFLLLAQPEWSAVREGRTVDSASFSAIIDATVSSRGDRIFVLDGPLGQVRIFGLSGRQEGQFGRRGEGPGELARVTHFGWFADTLWVMDRPNRLHLFTPAGRLVRTFTTLPNAWGLTAEGGTLTIDRGTSLASRETGDSAPFAIVHARGATVRTVAQFHRLVRPITVTASVSGQRVTLMRQQPLLDDPLFTPDRQGRHVYVLHRRTSRSPPHAYQLSKLTLAGDTVFSRAYPYRPVRLDKAALDAEVAELQQVILGQQAGKRTVVSREDLGKGIYRPPHRPAVEQMVVGQDGTVWLKRETPPQGTMANYVAVSPTGDLVGTVRLPRGERLVEANGQRLWTITTDEDDVPYVVRYRVSRSR